MQDILPFRPSFSSVSAKRKPRGSPRYQQTLVCLVSSPPQSFKLHKQPYRDGFCNLIERSQSTYALRPALLLCPIFTPVAEDTHALMACLASEPTCASARPDYVRKGCQKATCNLNPPSLFSLFGWAQLLFVTFSSVPLKIMELRDDR